MNGIFRLVKISENTEKTNLTFGGLRNENVTTDQNGQK